MSAIHKILDPLSPFLAGKKLEFLHNAALNLDRDLHDDGPPAGDFDRTAPRRLGFGAQR